MRAGCTWYSTFPRAVSSTKMATCDSYWNQAIAQVCAFASPFSASMSVIAIYQQSLTS
jgi:hypothetical protein